LQWREREKNANEKNQQLGQKENARLPGGVGGVKAHGTVQDSWWIRVGFEGGEERPDRNTLREKGENRPREGAGLSERRRWCARKKGEKTRH